MRKSVLCRMRTKGQIIMRWLISAFVVRCLDSIKPTLATPQLVPVAEQAGLSRTWS